MSGFSNRQLKTLMGKLDRTHIHTREVEGRKLDYIEGWFAMAEANRIFGFAGWDREMVHFERVFERNRADHVSCGYVARVRVRVRTAGGEVIREGTGWGHAAARASGDAHERALKAAETDATKRALATFGNRFGLCLYDKEQRGAASSPNVTSLKDVPINMMPLYDATGLLCTHALSPEGFCSGLRQLIEGTPSGGLGALATNNADALKILREKYPDLRNSRGEHYAEILTRLMVRKQAAVDGSRCTAASSDTVEQQKPPIVTEQPARAAQEVGSHPLANDNAAILKSDPEAINEESREAAISDHVSSGTVGQDQSTISPAILPQTDVQTGEAATLRNVSTTQILLAAPLAPSKITLGPRIDKSGLALGIERRLRDRLHLRRVAELPCVVCNRQPSHAHHVKFAQRRGLSMKVSDEFVVPLCALHHGDLHRSISEREWWVRQRIEPLEIAAQLWAERRGRTR